MNNNALFLVLGGVGLYLISRTKTSAPVTPGPAATAQPYTPIVAPSTAHPAFTVKDVVADVTNAWDTVSGAWSDIKNSGIVKGKSVPDSVPPSVVASVTASVPDSGGGSIALPVRPDYGMAPTEGPDASYGYLTPDPILPDTVQKMY